MHWCSLQLLALTCCFSAFNVGCSTVDVLAGSSWYELTWVACRSFVTRDRQAAGRQARHDCVQTVASALELGMSDANADRLWSMFC